MEKQKLMEFAEALRSKLNYFDELENVRFKLWPIDINFWNMLKYQCVFTLDRAFVLLINVINWILAYLWYFSS